MNLPNKKFDGYEAFKRAVEELCRNTRTIDEFSKVLKNDAVFVRLRNNARNELQEVYDLIRRKFVMPNLQVYLPVRKKISIMGKAFQSYGMPKEIRIYPLHGCSIKRYEEWIPTDIRLHSSEEIFETLVHESAHALEAHLYGIMEHEKNFVISYIAIESFLKEVGFVDLVAQNIRLTGVPENSYAFSFRSQSR